MRKITLLTILLFLSIWGSQAQCIRTAMYPSLPIVSNNMGSTQTVFQMPYTSEYSQISNVLIGTDYQFSCTQGATEKYITVTDLSNTVIAHGPSPLIVEAITTDQVRLHYSDNAACASTNAGHSITIKALLTCLPPINLSVSETSTTAATLMWEPQGEETAWQVYVVLNGSSAPTATTVGESTTSVDPSYTDSSLSAATSYQFYVRATCSDESSPWSGPLAFVTACNPVESFSENFDSFANATVPLCWSQIRNGVGSSTSSYARVADWNFYSPSRCVTIYNSNTATTGNIILAAPKVSNLSAGTHRLKFFAKTGTGTVNVQFGTVDNTTDEAVFTELEAITITNTYTEYIVDYAPYVGTDTFVAIRHNDTPYTSVSFDDMRWELTPSCADVSDITVNAITDTQALVNWESNGTETEWDIVYGATTVSDPNTLTPITPAPTVTPEGLITGLSPNTSYKVWVRSVCGEDFGAWSSPKTFKTNCSAIATIDETFDTYAYGTIPDCWAVYKNGTGVSASAYVQVSDWNFYSASRVIQINNSNSAITGNVMFASPVLTNIGDGTHRVKFYAKSSGGTGSLQIGTVDNTSEGSFTEYSTIALTSTYAEYIVEFSDTSTTDTRFAFRHNTQTLNSSIFIDNIIWELAPLCTDVSQITVAAVDTNTATIIWTPGGSETQWDVVFGATTVTDPTTLTPISPAPTVNPEGTLTGLTDNTSYKVWVRSVCGTENGVWIGPMTFKTPCSETATFNENFNSTPYAGMANCWSAVKNGIGVSQYATVQVLDFNFNSPSRAVGIYNAESPSTANLMLVSPNLSNLGAGTHRLKFFAKSSGASGSVQIGTVDNTTNNAIFTLVQTVPVTSTYIEYTVNIAASEDNFIAFRFNNSGTYNYIYIDDVIWEPIPLCPDVTGVAINNITTETADLTWEDQDDATINWQVAYGPATTTDPETLTPSGLLSMPAYTIEGLADNSSYKVWIRSSCGEINGNGLWMGPVEFTTQCLATTVPFTQNFETATTPALPSCSVSENTGGNKWGTNTVTQYGFNSKVMQYTYTCSSAANAWYYTQGIALTAGQEYTISYKYGSNSASFVEKLKVMYGTNPSAVQMTEEIADHTNINFNIAQTNVTTFTAPETAVYYFGFHAYSSPCQYNLYVDDIAISAALSNQAFNTSDFKFYPNPVKDVLNLSYDQTISNVAVFNLLGQKVIEHTLNANSTQINMANLAAGSYLVKVTSGNQIKTIKIIKE